MAKGLQQQYSETSDKRCSKSIPELFQRFCGSSKIQEQTKIKAKFLC